MVRTILYLLASVFLIALLRGVIGLIGKAVGQLFEPNPQPGGRSAPSPPAFSGELKKDPVCGTFVLPANSVKKMVGKETYYFCSPACRDKFPAT